MPKQALDNVLPGGTAELNFYNMVVRENVAELMSVVRTGSEDSVQVWMNVDENRKITLSGRSEGTANGFDGGSVSDNYPALWIGGGARVTLKDGMKIMGDSRNETGDNNHNLSLVTVYDGTLAIEDLAHVVTTTNGSSYVQADSLKTIGVQYVNNNFQGHIAVNSPLESTSTMYVQPVSNYGHSDPNGLTAGHTGKQIIQGDAVGGNVHRFRPYYGSYVFDVGGCIAAE
jgi:hypothetical protein